MTIFRFFDGEIRKSQVISAAEVVSTIDTSKSLDLFSVNLKRYPEISQTANVHAPMLVIFKDGQEVTRYPGGHIDQIEYVVSRVLCGLMGPKGELSAET